MSLSHRYQEFGRADFEAATAVSIAEEGLEELKLDSYEDGYKAGWDDSIKAQGAETEQAVSMIAQRLEDLSFTHAEAVVKLNMAMKPLLTKITHSLLPEMARQALGAHMLEQFDILLKDGTADALEIAVAPENLETLQSLLEGRAQAPFKFAAEPALTSGQVYIRTNRAEREINLDVVQQGIITAFDAFYAQTAVEEKHHG